MEGKGEDSWNAFLTQVVRGKQETKTFHVFGSDFGFVQTGGVPTGRRILGVLGVLSEAGKLGEHSKSHALCSVLCSATAGGDDHGQNCSPE